MDREALFAQIAAAFDGVSRAGGVSLREGEVLDCYGSDKKRERARRQDIEKRWQDVPNADIVLYRSSLFFMDAIGFRYYLPAFMSYVLRHMDDTWQDEWDITSVILTMLQVQQHSGKAYLETYKLITYAQAQAIGSFLQYVVEHGEENNSYDAARIFRDYWNYYP